MNAMNWRDLRHNERGSVSLWAVLIVAAFTLIVGISVDLVGQVSTKQRANDVAGQAARIAGEQADTNTLMGGTSKVIVNPQQARRAALDYIAGADMTGAATIEAGATKLVITTTATYRPLFLTSVGIGPLTVTGTATARLIRTQNGSER